MYSEQELSDAVAAGVLTPDQVDRFRAFAAGRRATSGADEEQFRLVTGFNDIFVAIAGVVLLVAAGSLLGFLGFFAPLIVAGLAWFLAEYFTRQRRMALPSIIFLLVFAIGIARGVFAFLYPLLPRGADDEPMLAVALAAAATVAGCVGHWLRFHVPITIAAGVAALVAALVGTLAATLDLSADALLPLLALLGVATFAFAMRWDASDIERRTRRSDVAFWLHLLAAPLIVHPLFAWLGVFSGETGTGAALAAVAIYAVLACLALVIDRRALMVSALAYVLYAISTLLQAGGIATGFALTGVLIGSALLLLSALWQTIRRPLVAALPPRARAWVPAAPTPRPAS